MRKNRFGIINLFKPRGLTSRQAVDHVARLVRPAKAGHAGTLDPLATGVLVVCVGKATRLIEIIQQQPKSYDAQFVLGCESDTDDVTGNVDEISVDREISQAELEAILPQFSGRITQTPPKFSAVHVGGARAYQLARRGDDVELAPREVEIFRLKLTRFAYPEFDLSIDCGSGTYIRSVGRDIGRALGCGAVMSSLIRTRIGPFRIEDAVAPERLTPEAFGNCLHPPATAVAGLPQFSAQAQDRDLIRAGRTFGSDVSFDVAHNGPIAVLDSNGELLCLAELDVVSRQLLPRRVFIE